MTQEEVLIIFLGIGIALWPVIFGLHSFVSGWHSLSRKYKYKGKLPGLDHAFRKKRRALISLKKEERQHYLFFMGYGFPFMPNFNTVKIRSDSNAIYFCRPDFFPRYFYPPLKIPFSEISGKELLIFSKPFVELTTKADLRQKIWISVKLAEWLEARSGHQWAFSRL